MIPLPSWHAVAAGDWRNEASPEPAARCRACGGGRGEIFFRTAGVPANSCLLIPTREEALSWPRGDIVLVFCPDCGFVFNSAFAPRLTEYSARYEETQGFSATFQSFQERLATDLVQRYRLFGRTVLEIGCGKGEFLALLCSLGGNCGLGFDPAYIEDRRPDGGSFRVIRDFFSEKYAHCRADFVCCKMTLEHVPEPVPLVRAAGGAVAGSPGGIVFFQVPDATRILRTCAFEDIYYEHCSYFAPVSLAGLFRLCGFEILRLQTAYDGQYLALEARPAPLSPPEPSAAAEIDRLRSWAAGFGREFQRRREIWRRRLGEMHAAGRQVVLWGSGSKGVAFLTALGIDREVAAVVDINPHRQGCFMAGTGHPIIAPEQLQDLRPETVIVMNAVYRDEIGRNLTALGLSPKLLTLEPDDAG